MKYSTVIVAAGKGQRMKLGYNKVYARLDDGRTILEHAMDIFLNDEDCVQITVVTAAQDYYHNVRDTYTNLNPECIGIVRKILQDAVNMFANAGQIF